MEYYFVCKYINVCFIGHRKIMVTQSLTDRLTALVSDLIKSGVQNFIFGSHSQFNDLCYKIVSKLQKQYPFIKRIHYCLAYENYASAGINNLYEHEIDCESAINAGKSAYIVRNKMMIDDSDLCVFYYNENYQPLQQIKSQYGLTTHQSRSGTAIAFQYARRNNRVIVNLK